MSRKLRSAYKYTKYARCESKMLLTIMSRVWEYINSILSVNAKLAIANQHFHFGEANRVWPIEITQNWLIRADRDNKFISLLGGYLFLISWYARLLERQPDKYIVITASPNSGKAIQRPLVVETTSTATDSSSPRWIRSTFLYREYPSACYIQQVNANSALTNIIRVN